MKARRRRPLHEHRPVLHREEDSHLRPLGGAAAGRNVGLYPDRAARGSRVHHQERPGHHQLSRRHRAGSDGRGDRPHRGRHPADGAGEEGDERVLSGPLHRHGRNEGPVRQERPAADLGRTAPQGGRHAGQPAARLRRAEGRRRLRRRVRRVLRRLRRRLFLRGPEGLRQDPAPRAAAVPGRRQDRDDRRPARSRLSRDFPGAPGHHGHFAQADPGRHRRPEQRGRRRVHRDRRQVHPAGPDGQAEVG